MCYILCKKIKLFINKFIILHLTFFNLKYEKYFFPVKEKVFYGNSCFSFIQGAYKVSIHFSEIGSKSYLFFK